MKESYWVQQMDLYSAEHWVWHWVTELALLWVLQLGSQWAQHWETNSGWQMENHLELEKELHWVQHLA